MPGSVWPLGGEQNLVSTFFLKRISLSMLVNTELYPEFYNSGNHIREMYRLSQRAKFVTTGEKLRR